MNSTEKPAVNFIKSIAVFCGSSNSNDEFINAEIGIQSGNNNYWGIYHDNDTDDLRFWNVEDRVVFTDEGIETDKIELEEVCLNGVCIDNWRDLQRMLNLNY